jgi:hypothetical protein
LSNCQSQVLLRGFEAAVGGHLPQSSRQEEEKQLFSPLWQSSRSHINCCSKIPDFQKHYSDSLHPYSSDLATCEFFIFPKFKLRLKESRFDTTDGIHTESQEVIDTLTFENFQGCMKSWETHSDRYIHAQGDYFEGEFGN